MEADERMQVVQQLCKVHGVGAVIANEWYTRGIRTIEEALGAGLMNEQQQIGTRRRDPALFPSPSTPTSDGTARRASAASASALACANAA